MVSSAYKKSLCKFILAKPDASRKFKLSNEKEKREFELSLEYSIYNLTPEIIIE